MHAHVLLRHKAFCDLRPMLSMMRRHRFKCRDRVPSAQLPKNTRMQRFPHTSCTGAAGYSGGRACDAGGVGRPCEPSISCLCLASYARCSERVDAYGGGKYGANQHCWACSMAPQFSGHSIRPARASKHACGSVSKSSQVGIAWHDHVPNHRGACS
jgi:hypothetical protein